MSKILTNSLNSFPSTLLNRFAGLRNWKMQVFAVMSLLLLTACVSVTANAVCVPPATVYVDDNWVGTTPGTDLPGPATDFGCDSFATIQDGVDGVAPGGTVNVAAGTYLEPQVLIEYKGLTLQGAGASVTTIDGGNAVVSSGEDATLYVVNPNAPIVIDGFTFTRPAHQSPVDAEITSIKMNFGTPDPSSPPVTISNNHFIGVADNGLNQFDNAIWIYYPPVDVDINITNNEFDHLFQPILMEVPQGGAVITGNNFHDLFSNTFDTTTYPPQAMSLWAYGGINITAPVTISTNTFSAFDGWSIVLRGGGASLGGTENAQFVNDVTIQGNNINADGVGIVFRNPATTSGDAALDGIVGATISGNTIRSTTLGTGTGIWLRGPNNDTTITSNSITRYANGILSEPFNVADTSSGVGVHFNSITQNTTGVSNLGLSIDAENNWWGCNFGAGIGGAGCTGTTNGITGAVDANPWLTLTSTANPSVLGLGETSAVTSMLTINSAAEDTSGSGTVPNGIPASFVGTLGTVNPANSTTLAGITGTTFTATGYGLGGVDTTIDGQTTNAAINVNVACRTVSIPTGLTVPSNTQFLVSINVDDTTARGILGYKFTLTYNPAVVTPIAVVTGGTLSTGWTVTTNNSSGTLVVTNFNTSPLSGSGTLVKVRFISIGGITSTSSLNLTSFVFNEGVPCVNTTNGDVTIISGTVSGVVTYVNASGPPVRVPNTTINAAGSPSRMTTTDGSGFYSLSDFGAGSYTVTPSHANQVNHMNGITPLDASRVAQHTVGVITLNATQRIAADVSGNGTVSSLDAAYIAQWTVGIPNPSVTGTWKFLPANRSYPNVQTDQTNQDYSAILMGDVTGNWDPAGAARPSLTDDMDQEQQQMERSAQVVTVTAPTQFAAAGSNFTVSLSTTNTTGEGILAYHFDLLYDENVIFPQAIPCDVTGTVSSGMSASCNAATPGVLQVSLYGTMPTTGAGILLKLKFNAVGAIGNISPLTIQDFMFNEGIPLDVTTNGQVSLFAPTSVGAQVGGKVMTALGQPVPATRVIITDTNGESRTTLSSSLGYYRFYEVQVGQTYIITVESKRYTFIPLPVTVGQDLTNVDLIADQ